MGAAQFPVNAHQNCRGNGHFGLQCFGLEGFRLASGLYIRVDQPEAGFHLGLCLGGMNAP